MRGHIQAGVFFFVFLPLLPLLTKFVTETSLAEVGRMPVALERARLERDPAGRPTAAAKPQAAVADASDFRAELLMGLDLLVRAQRVVQSETATYATSLGRVPDVLGSLTHYYRIEISKATRTRLLVVAVGEGRRAPDNEGLVAVGDRVAIDENFHVNLNFPMPEPPRDYLHTLARTVMNRVFAAQYRLPERSELDLWEGVFRGYFRYEVRPVSAGGRTIVAVGINAPVKGDLVEMQPGANLYQWVLNHRNTAWAERELRADLERIYLAQKIFEEHTGSYAPSLKSLVGSWNGLASLGSELSGKSVQEFQLDPTFGFQVEVAQRSPASAGGVSELDLEAAGGPEREERAWSINGYGQVAEVATVEKVVDQFEQARKEVTHGTNASEPAALDYDLRDPLQELAPGGSAEAAPSSAAEALSERVEVEKGRKPLLIEPVGPDK